MNRLTDCTKGHGMGFVLGLIGALLLLFFAGGVVLAVFTWFVMKWVFILFAIIGGVIGGVIFQERAGVLLGAVVGVGLGFSLLAFLGSRNINDQ